MYRDDEFIDIAHLINEHEILENKVNKVGSNLVEWK